MREFKTLKGPAKCPANHLLIRKGRREKPRIGQTIAKNRQPRNGFAGTVVAAESLQIEHFKLTIITYSVNGEVALMFLSNFDAALE